MGNYNDTKAKINFLDDEVGDYVSVPLIKIIKLEDAYKTLALEWYFEDDDTYYPCTIEKQTPLTVKFDDDKTTKTEIAYLRGKTFA